jgi:hypothetical protein
MRNAISGRLRVAAVGLALVAAGALATSAPATADQVWLQSVGRHSVDVTCPTSTEADLAAGWSAWGASWEQWPNGGKGGYVCTRSITWAHDTQTQVHVGAGCVLYDADVMDTSDGYVDFGTGWSLPAGTLEYIDDPTCSGEPPGGVSTGLDIVYAPPGVDADALCADAFPGTQAVAPFWDPDPFVYHCVD